MTNIYEQMNEELKKILTAVPDEELKQLITDICNAKRIFCAGCGRSGLMMKAFAMRLMHLGFSAYVVLETNTPSIREHDLLIIGSSSGMTSSMVRIADRAKKEYGAKIALITSHVVSDAAAISDTKVVLPAGIIQNSIQPGGNLFEQSLLLCTDGIIIQLMKQLKIAEDVMDYNHTNLE